MDNKLELEIDGKKEIFDIILKVDVKDENGTYILYTQNEKNDVGDVIVYAGILEEKKDKVNIKPVEDEEKLELLADILEQIKTRTDKKEVEEKWKKY